jgi:hypothetical protein
VLVGAILGGILGTVVFLVRKHNAQQRPAAQPIDVFAHAVNAIYPTGARVSGIAWSPRFTELRVIMTNNSPDSITNIDLMLRPDKPVVEIAQVSNIPEVFISPPVRDFRQEVVKAGTGQRIVNPLVLIATSAAFRIHCKELPRGEHLELVMAIATPDDTPRPSQQGIFSRDYVLKFSNKDGTASWMGKGSDAKGRIEEVYKTERSLTGWIEIKGTYKANGVEEKIDTTKETRDIAADAITKIPK